MVDDAAEKETLPQLPPPPRWDAAFGPGMQVDRYVVLQALGRGGTATVYAAYDPELDRKVALKVMLPTVTEGDDPEALQARLLLEARAMARLSHPNVVTLYQVGTAPEGRIYLAMELVEGGTLHDWLRAEKRSWRQILSLLCQAGEGLLAAHRAEMIHRDFKLDNVLVRKDGRPQVTDFGIVWAARDRAPAGERPTAPGTGAPRGSAEVKVPSQAPSLSFPRLTMTGSLLGTPGYMAPEQYTLDQQLDVRTDVFAFCATLYRALYGKRPFEGDSLDKVAEATLGGCVREPPARTPVPRWVHKVILWGLAVNREDRPESMEVVLAALRADPVKRRRRWMAAGAAALLVVAAGLSVRAVGQSRVRACHRTADQMAGVWDDKRKGAIASAFRATGLVYAEDTFGRVTRRIDDYAASWTAGAYAACEATRVRGEQSQEMLDLRMQCLGERLDELGALGDVFAMADAKTVETSLHATIALPAVEACANVDRLSVTTRLPADPKARAEIHALQVEVAAGRELFATGKEVAGTDRLRAVGDRVKAVGFGPLVVAWTMGSAASDRRRDLQASIEGWQRAIELAEVHHLDRERAECEVELAGILEEAARYTESHLWFTLGRATLSRVGGEPKLELKADMLEGCTYFDEAKHADAARLFQRVVDRARVDHIDDPFRVAISHSLLGLALGLDASKADEAMAHERTALAIMDQAFGGKNVISVLSMLMNLSSTQEEIGQLDEALKSVSDAVATCEAAIARKEVVPQHIDLGLGLLTRGDILVRLGRHAEALDSLRRATEICQANGRTDAVPSIDADLARALIGLGRLDEAARVLSEGRAIADANKETGPDVRAILLRTAADLALAGAKPRTDEALELAEAALKLAETGASDLYDLSSTRLVVARALSRAQRDPERVRTLAARAAEGFEKLHDRRRAEEAAAVASAGK